MADDFDPDAYLGSPGGGSGFDPDAYLKGTTSIGGGAQEAISQQNAAWEAAKQARAVNPQSFGETLRQKLREAGTKIQHGVDVLRGHTDINEPPEGVMGPTYPGEYPSKPGPAPSMKVPEDLNQNRTGFRPFGAPTPGAERTGIDRYANAIGEIAAGAASAAASPVTTGIRKGGTEPIESMTGVPAEKQEAVALAGAPFLSQTSRLLTSTPITTERFRPNPYGPPTEAEAARATTRPGLDPNVRVMAPTVPHSYRPEAGAAGGPDVLASMSPEARNKAQEIFDRTGHNEHTVEQRIDEMSPHETMSEFDPEFQTHAEQIQSRPGPAQTEIAQTLRQRNAETRDRILNEAGEAFGPYTNQRAWENEVREAQQRASRPFWQRFNNLVITPTEDLERVLPRLEVAGALRAANRSLRIEGLPETMGFPLAEEISPNAPGPPTEQTQVPTARAFQLAKEHLDDKIGGAINAGERNEARRLTGLKRDLVNAIDNHPDPNIAGVWRDARDSWATYADLLNARRIGEGLFSSRLGTEEAAEVLGDLSDQQRRAAMMGARAHIENVAGGSRARVESRLINELLAGNNREKIGSLLNDPARADNLFSAIEAEQRMRQHTADTIGNSRTARRLAGTEWDAPQTSLLDRAAQVATAVQHPIITGAKMLGRHLDTGAEQAAMRLREEIGRLMTLQGPERDAALRALAQRSQEGPGGLGGPVMGRQPLAPEVLERGRSGRPIRRTKLPIGTEDRILERAEQRLGEGPRVVGSQKEMDDVLRKNWAEHGDTLDYDDPGVWEDYIGKWNKAHPERKLDPNSERLSVKSGAGSDPRYPDEVRTVARDENGPVEGFHDFAKPYDRWLDTQRKLYPGAKEANRYFAEDQPELTAFTSHRQMRNLENETGIQLLPDKMQAMAFKDEPTRRRFLQGMASAVATTNPELSKIAAGLTKATAPLPRLEDAGYGRSLARQAIYMFGDDKAKAAQYLLDQLKRSRPGSVVERANRDAIRHITSGDAAKEPSIWQKSVAEMRAHDEQIRAAQAARRAADLTQERPAGGTQEEPVRGRRELPGGEGQLEAPGRTDQEAGRAGEAEPPLEGLPRKVTVPGIGKIEVGPHQPIRDLARQYMQDAGLPYNPPKDYAKVDSAHARRIADEYEKMAHAPNDPQVKAAYEAMAKETMAQWQAIKKTGFKAEFIPPGSPDPYAASPRLATEDIKKNNHMWVFSTRDGFGSPGEAGALTLGERGADFNPLLADTGEVISGQPALINDIFRVVHDYFGHAKEGVGFRADGEENAWRSHSAMYSPLARKAMTTETRGQNSWLNYGPHGDKNRSAKTEDTVFADQKTGILPDWVVNEGSGKPETIKSAASRFRGNVYEGPAHMVIDDEVPEKIGVDPFDFMREREEGFTTSEGRFVSRDEAKKIAGIPGDMRFESSQIKRQPLARDVAGRGRSGRPTQTTPMATGREADVLRSGYNKATGEHPARISQRLVTSKRAESNPENLTVDMAAARETPETYQHNVELLRPLLPQKFRNAPTEKVASAFVDHVADNLKWLYNQVPPEIRDRSKLWYDGGRSIIDHWVNQYGVKDSAAAGVLAALSPQKDWFQNVSLASRVLEINRGGGKNFYNGFTTSPEMHAAFEGRPALTKDYRPLLDQIAGKSLGDIDKMDIPKGDQIALKALWTRLYDEAHHLPEHHIITPEGGAAELATGKKAPKKVAWGSLDQIGNAIEALDANGSPAALDKLMGDKHKVRNFYNNLLNPNSKMGDVTIDTHAVAAGLLKPLSGNSTEVSHNFNSSPMKDKQEPGFVASRGSALTGVQGTYPFYADAYRKAAADVGILPREMQSITWEAVRGLFEAMQKQNLKGAINNIWRQYRAGRLSLDDARQRVLKEAGGIKPPDWFGDGTVAANGRGAANETELPQSRISRGTAEGAGRRGRGEPATEAPETVRAAAIKLNDGRVFTGPNHASIMEDISRALGKRSIIDDIEPTETGMGGFVTSTGRLVDRDEAMKLAKKNDQINAKGKAEKGFPRKHLISENTEFRRKGGRVWKPDQDEIDGGNEQKMLRRKRYHYAHNRGSKEEHCSNCSMFRAPHGCTAVGGFIAKKGKCDIWAKGREHRDDGGSIFDPTPMADNPPYSLSQNFHERLPEAEGLVDDRRQQEDPYARMMSTNRSARRALGNWELVFDKRLPRTTGTLSKDLGIRDIGRERKAFGGGFSPWQGMMRQPWWQNLMRNQGGLGRGPMPNPPARPPIAGTAAGPPSNPPAGLAAMPPNPPANPPAQMGLQGSPPSNPPPPSVMSAVTSDVPPMMTADSALPSPSPNPPATGMTQPWRGGFARPPGMARGGRLQRQDGGRVSHFDEANQALKMSPQEQALYQRHLTNLWGKGGVDNPDGSRSSLYQSVIEHKGKFYNIPTVWDGKILDPAKAEDRAHAEGIEKFPSYATPDEADARYDDMHKFMEQDTGDYFQSQERAAGGRVNHAPTDAQKKAGNYKKRHITVHGLDISIENEKGSTRSGKDKNGKPWSVTMPAHYGYFKRTEGADGDHVDVYLGPHIKSDKAFIVDQRDADTGRFDEHKVMLGFASEAQARACYLRGFSDHRGERRLGHMTEMSIEQFKRWLKETDDMSWPAKISSVHILKAPDHGRQLHQ